ncbi:hypothetical protein ACRYI5_01050 [Furfurilactobacillus sp. WILCCON 0119]
MAKEMTEAEIIQWLRLHDITVGPTTVVVDAAAKSALPKEQKKVDDEFLAAAMAGIKQWPPEVVRYVKKAKSEMNRKQE